MVSRVGQACKAIRNMFLVLLPGQFFPSHFLFFNEFSVYFQDYYHFINKVTQFIIESCVNTAVLSFIIMEVVLNYIKLLIENLC